MRIPPYYRQPSWQRFFAGMAIGGIISWFIFLFIFGEWQDRYSKQIETQIREIHDLKNEKKIWQEEFEEKNKKIQEQLTIQEITIKIDNSEKYKLDSYSVYELEDDIEEDINMMIAKDLDTVYKSRGLIKKTIENRVHVVHEKRYRVVLKEIYVNTTLTIHVEMILD